MTAQETTTAPAAGTVDLITLEYTTLKAEQLSRIGIRDNLVYATLATIGAVIFGAAKLDSALPLLALPLAVTVLGWTYLANDRKISEIGRYVRTYVTPRIETLAPGSKPFAWESLHRASRNKTGQLLIDLGAFCVPSLAAIVATCFRGGPWWSVLAALVELVAVWGLADQIVKASGLLRPSAGRRAGVRSNRSNGEQHS